MNKLVVFAVVVVALLAAVATAKNVAVIVAGSNYFYNYRHQSDIAHHYQLLRQRGYAASDIITMMYDDVPADKSNPFPGQLYNTPCDGDACKDNYANIKIDYKGKDVSPANFVNVLIGNNTGIGPVLQTTAQDNVLVTFSDHGAPGLLAFPAGSPSELYVRDFKSALDTMTAKKMYAKLAIYIEACESGSMCMNVIPDGANIACLTASNDKQSSYAKFCGSEAKVQGKTVGSCLADEFAWALATYVETNGVNHTVGEHADYLVKAVSQSPVQYFGAAFTKEWKLSDFFASPSWSAEQEAALMAKKNGGMLGAVQQSPESTQFVDSRDITLDFLFQRYMDSQKSLTQEERFVAGEELLSELQNRINAEKIFARVAQSALSAIENKLNVQINSVTAQSIQTMESSVAAIDCGSCCETSFRLINQSPICKFDDYSLKFARTIHNLCTLTGKDVTQEVVKAIRVACTPF